MMRGMIAALGTIGVLTGFSLAASSPGSPAASGPAAGDCYIRHSLINAGRRSRGRGECEAGCRTAGYSRGDAIAEPALRSSAWDSPAVSACLAVISSYDTGCPPSII